MSAHPSARPAFLAPKPTYKSPQLNTPAGEQDEKRPKHVPAPLSLISSTIRHARRTSDSSAEGFVSGHTRTRSRSISTGFRPIGPSTLVQPLPTLPASPAFQSTSRFDDSDEDDQVDGLQNPSGHRSRLAALGHPSKLFRGKRNSTAPSGAQPVPKSGPRRPVTTEGALKPLLLQAKPSSALPPPSPRTIDLTLQLQLQGANIRKEPLRGPSLSSLSPLPPPPGPPPTIVSSPVDMDPAPESNEQPKGALRKSRSSSALRYDPQRRPKQLPPPPPTSQLPDLPLSSPPLPPVPTVAGSADRSSGEVDVPLDERFGLPRQAPKPNRLPPQKPPPSCLPPPPPPEKDSPATVQHKPLDKSSFQALVTSVSLPRSLHALEPSAVTVLLDVGGAHFTTLLSTLRGSPRDQAHLCRSITEQMRPAPKLASQKVARTSTYARRRKRVVRPRSGTYRPASGAMQSYESDEFESVDEDEQRSSMPLSAHSLLGSSASDRTSSGSSIDTPSSLRYLQLETQGPAMLLSPAIAAETAANMSPITTVLAPLLKQHDEYLHASEYAAKRLEDLCPSDVEEETCCHQHTDSAGDPASSLLFSSPSSKLTAPPAARSGLTRRSRASTLTWSPSKTLSSNRPGIRFTASSFLPTNSPKASSVQLQEPQSAASAMVSVFVDRDPGVYAWLLQALRTGRLPAELTLPPVTTSACASQECALRHAAWLQKTQLQSVREEAAWLGYSSIVAMCDTLL